MAHEHGCKVPCSHVFAHWTRDQEHATDAGDRYDADLPQVGKEERPGKEQHQGNLDPEPAVLSDRKPKRLFWGWPEQNIPLIPLGPWSDQLITTRQWKYALYRKRVFLL